MPNIEKIQISIIGLGYVGLPLAIEFGKIYPTVGYDLSHERINNLKKKIDINAEVKKIEFHKSKHLSFSSNEKDLSKSNFFIVTVPTPVNKKNIPDLKNIKEVTKIIGKYLKKNSIVVYESTVYPGLTEEICVPILSKISGLTWKKDFNVGYSPERINPGDKKNKLVNIIKLVSGDSSKSLKKIYFLYSKIIKAGVYKAPSIKIAEAAKVIENTQRDINIAFMNELSLIFEKLKIPTEEVLKAAKTKWNFIDFKPGLVGGHCIGVDPYYLSFKAKSLNYSPQIIEAGRNLNDKMYKIVSKKIINFLKDKLNKKILFIGIAFKANTNDIRNSKFIDIIKFLNEKKINNIDLFDPLIDRSQKEISNLDFKKINPSIVSNKYDVVVIGSFHKTIEEKYDKKEILKTLKKNSLLFDINNSFFEFLRKKRSKNNFTYLSL